MSRYTCAGNHPRHRLVVGCDRRLQTLFVQVEDLAWESNGATIDEDTSLGDAPEEGLLLWHGTQSGEILEVEQLVEIVKSYGVLPPEIVARLHAELSGLLRPS